ncbi:3-deoxy-manno-octulosonate cytidylyltransferase [Lewinella sp. 4G2]|uniref:3-deoxy-manno-octulosonate cytidylyltransferase n=1 Tax=Lewinella sp. 4G2 TaxID=1803372 RepID=UPI0007B4E0DD|nr:3-deoxy-manno-octulosonate cytidylyltransferase [Lewinella sp. 4G2]OAV45319.1 3-deoxy-manno-octulosonate cytidylyltransferase [Lewinella sp. 4G2]
MVLAVIPARWASTRFPGKPLAQIGDKAMVDHVYDRVSANRKVDVTVVATDDQRIYDHVASRGGTVMMTKANHKTGTDRVAEVALAYPAATVVINVQGDEPFVAQEQIDKIVEAFEEQSVDIATLAHPIDDEASLLSPNVVKVVRTRSGKALYFSRHAIPFLRDQPVGRWLRQCRHLQHIGIYAFRAEALRTATMLSIGFLEQDESLEQLRWLENDLVIHVGVTDQKSFGVDVPNDLERANATWRALSHKQ